MVNKENMLQKLCKKMVHSGTKEWHGIQYWYGIAQRSGAVQVLATLKAQCKYSSIQLKKNKNNMKKANKQTNIYIYIFTRCFVVLSVLSQLTAAACFRCILTTFNIMKQPKTACQAKPLGNHQQKQSKSHT